MSKHGRNKDYDVPQATPETPALPSMTPQQVMQHLINHEYAIRALRAWGNFQFSERRYILAWVVVASVALMWLGWHR